MFKAPRAHLSEYGMPGSVEQILSPQATPAQDTEHERDWPRGGITVVEGKNLAVDPTDAFGAPFR